MTDVDTLAKEIIEKVRAREGAEKIKTGAFAALLGVKRQIWQHTLSGRKRLGPKVCMAIYEAYPELQQDVTNYLIAFVRASPDNASAAPDARAITATASEEHGTRTPAPVGADSGAS